MWAAHAGGQIGEWDDGACKLRLMSVHGRAALASQKQPTTNVADDDTY